MTVELPEADQEGAEWQLHQGGAGALEIRDSASPPLPGVQAPAAGKALLIAAFEDAKKARRLEREMAVAFPLARIALEAVPHQDWSIQWRERVRAVETPRLWVGPPWLEADAPPRKSHVVIEPKMAFGTGDHATTWLCLQAVDAYLDAHAGASVLDVGTGTGVLAIAARKLGAGRVVGTDNDAVSVDIARETAAANGAGDVELSGTPLDAIAGRFDLVMANILANTLVELAPLLVPRAKDRLVLAGVLVPQQDSVVTAFERLGCRLASTTVQGEWIRLDFNPR